MPATCDTARATAAAPTAFRCALIVAALAACAARAGIGVAPHLPHSETFARGELLVRELVRVPSRGLAAAVLRWPDQR